MTWGVGLVGCGRWGRHVLRDLQALGASVRVVDPSEEARAYARAAGVEASPHVDELGAVDGVVVTSPTTTHERVVESLLPQGVPLFVEKPLTADPRSAERLAARASDRLFVMEKWRYHPGVEALGEIARSGELGPVQGLRSRRLGWDGPHPDVDPVWILAPHDLSILTEVLGEIPEPRACAVETVNGTVAGLVGLLGTAPWASVEISVRTAEKCRDLVLMCRDGSAALRGASAEVIDICRSFDPRRERPLEPERRPISTEWPLIRELRAFLAHLDGGPPPRSSAVEGARTVRAVARLQELGGAVE
jgi:predicted dehydrogenase